jgi:hypothetical protein
MPPRPTERYDVPDDAAGRVRYVDQPNTADAGSTDARPTTAPVGGGAPPPTVNPAPAPAVTAAVARADEIAGWVAVAALAAVLLVVFILGMRLTS